MELNHTKGKRQRKVRNICSCKALLEVSARERSCSLYSIPEGGITDKEIEGFGGWSSMHRPLGPRIIEARTAPMYAQSELCARAQ